MKGAIGDNKNKCAIQFQRYAVFIRLLRQSERFAMALKSCQECTTHCSHSASWHELYVTLGRRCIHGDITAG
jgi:hypothetical protein